MPAKAFAGCLASGGPMPAGGRLDRLEASLRPDGPSTSVASGALTVAWTPPDPASPGTLCLIDGQPRVDALAAKLGHDPAHPPDRLLATGYRMLGNDVLAHVGGDFALLLWEPVEQRGLLARDRLGERPLFVSVREGALLFASEIRNVLALLAMRPPPDGVAMAYWLARTNERGDRTLYDGIRRLPAGHALSLELGGWHRWRYWVPRYTAPRDIGATEAATAVREGMLAAVERALVGAKRPGLLLSGGLDSAGIAAAAGSLPGGRPITAYSAVFPDNPEVDESARIARVRDWLGVPGVEAAFREGSALGAAVQFLATWQVPSVSPNLFIWLPLLRRAAADGVDVLLDGEGGDELFGCAPYVIADRLRRGRPLTALRLARAIPGMGAAPQPRWIYRALTRYGLKAALPHGLHGRMRRARGRARGPVWLTDEAQRIHRDDEDLWVWKLTSGPRWWAQLADVLTGAVDALGAPDQLRREAALCGLTARHPLRDEKLTQLILSLPPELAFNPNVDRPLARRALRGLLPEDFLTDDHKPVFNSLLTGSLRGRDHATMRALLADPHPELARRVRRAALQELLNIAPKSSLPPAWAREIWQLATLELWLAYQSDPALPDRIAVSAPTVSMVDRPSARPP